AAAAATTSRALPAGSSSTTTAETTASSAAAAAATSPSRASSPSSTCGRLQVHTHTATVACPWCAGSQETAESATGLPRTARGRLAEQCGELGGLGGQVE